MRKEKKKVEESTLEENKHHRIFNRIRIKLFINLLLELLGVFSIVTSLMIIQKRVACNSQNSNSELKIKEVAERMINNELDKEKVIAKFDEFYLSKAEVLGDYFASNSDKLEEVFLNPNTTGREVLKEISSPSKYNMDGIILFRTIGDSYSANFYSRNYEDMTIADVGLDTSVISPYITENNKLRDVFIPFTYNHSAKGNEPKIIDNYTVIYSNDALISRYYGCKISDSTFALVGQEPSSLFKEILRLVSLNAILSDITVGKEGFMLALDNNYNVIYAKDDELNGASIEGMPKERKESFKGWIKVDGKELYAVSRSFSEDLLKERYEELELPKEKENEIVNNVLSSYGNLTFVVASVSISEINAYRAFTCTIGGIIFFIVSIIQICYCLFVKRDEFDKKKDIKYAKIGKKLYLNADCAKKVTPVTVLGIITIVAITSFTQVLFSISNQIDLNKTYLNDISNVLETNNAQAERLEEATDNLYFNKLDILKYTLLSDDNIHGLFVDDTNSSVIIHRDDISPEMRNINRTYLRKLADKIDVENIYLFNMDGETIATSSAHQDFDLSKEPGSQSYPFWNVLKGYELEYAQEIMVDEIGNSSKYIGKALQRYYLGADGNDYYDVVGLIQIEVNANDYLDKFEACKIKNVLDDLEFGNSGFAFAVNKNTKTMAYYPGDFSYDITKKSANDFGLPNKVLVDGYFNTISIEGKSLWISSMEYGDYLVYVAVPTSEVLAQVLPATIAIGIIDFVMLSIFTLLNIIVTESEKNFIEESDEVKESIKKSVKGGSTLSRWDGSFLAWNKKTAGQKLGSIISVMFTIFVLFLFIIMFTNIVKSLSIVGFITGGFFDRGINIFSLTEVLVFSIMAIVLANLVRAILKFCLKHADARAETVGRLVSNLIKYAVYICVIFHALSAFGVDTSTLITGAGILSIIIGLGSQQLIQDILAGLFIVFEGEFRVEDIVTIGDWRGTVLEIGLRTTKIMDNSKNIKIFANSQISGVINMTREYSVAKVIVGTEYGDSIERIEAILKNELPKVKEKLSSTIIDGPFYKGVTSLSESSVDLLIIATCTEKDRMQLTRDLNREVKLIFDNNNINVPFPQITVSKINEEGDVTPTKSEIRKSKKFVEEQKIESDGIEVRETK